MRLKYGLGQFNAVLLAIYFIPSFGIGALRALTSPVYGLDDKVNLATAVFYRHLFDLPPHWLANITSVLAGIKLLMATVFLAYVIDVARATVMARDADRETLDAALIVASIGIAIWAIPALSGNNADMVRLYATQFLLIAGAMAVVAIERLRERPTEPVTRQRVWAALRRADLRRPGKSARWVGAFELLRGTAANRTSVHQ